MNWFGPGSSSRDRYDSQKSSYQHTPDPGSSTCSLSGQLLATCRLVYNEGINVLYGQNWFGLWLYICQGWDYGGHGDQAIEVESSFFEGFGIYELDPPWPSPSLHPREIETNDRSKVIRYQFAVDRIRRLRLILNLDSGSSPACHVKYSILKHSLHLICQRVKDLPLQRLNIDLHSRYPMTRPCILEPL